MRKFLYIASLVLLASTTLLFPKEFTLLAGVGVPFSGEEGFLILYGTEMRLTQTLYLQLMGVSNLENQDGPVNVGTAGLGLTSLNLSGLVKIPVSPRFKGILKAGILLKFTNYMLPPAGYTGTVYLSYLNVPYIKKKGGLGAGIGLGIEYALSKKFGLVFSGTFRKLFWKASKSEWDNFKQWYTIHSGISYKI